MGIKIKLNSNKSNKINLYNKIIKVCTYQETDVAKMQSAREISGTLKVFGFQMQ